MWHIARWWHIYQEDPEWRTFPRVVLRSNWNQGYLDPLPTWISRFGGAYWHIAWNQEQDPLPPHIYNIIVAVYHERTLPYPSWLLGPRTHNAIIQVNLAEDRRIRALNEDLENQIEELEAEISEEDSETEDTDTE